MKILFVGPMGAGKTTAISAISDIEPVSTEALNSDKQQSNKATTTVALDYGEIVVDGGDTLMLYGIPGQERFSFMWPILGQGALGAILLMNTDLLSSEQDLINYLDAFADLVAQGTVVIGVWSADAAADNIVDHYQVLLEKRNLALPIMHVDVRDKQHVLMLIEMLIVNIEVNQLSAGCQL